MWLPWQFQSVLSHPGCSLSEPQQRSIPSSGLWVSPSRARLEPLPWFGAEAALASLLGTPGPDPCPSVVTLISL